MEDIPYEDLHMTKSIVRMEMNMLAYAITKKESIAHLHELLKDAKQEIVKLKDQSLDKALQDIGYLIDHHYPISESTHWDIIASLGEKFRFIDRKTLY
ncbi:MAG: hypothetical protein AAGI90_04785 [Chlamydiota bacterium]